MSIPYIKRTNSHPKHLIGYVVVSVWGVRRLAFPFWWTKERKIVHWFKVLRKVSFPNPSSLLWLFLLNVDHVDALVVLWVHLQLAIWKMRIRMDLLGTKDDKHERGENILSGKNYQRRRRKSPFDWICEFHHHQHRRSYFFFLSVPLGDSFDSKSITFLCLLNDTNGENTFLHIHIRLFRHHETQEILFTTSDLTIMNFLPLPSPDKKDMLWNKMTLKVCHWPT